MRVKILTYHFSDNYGALFQAYGLREWFRKKGIEADFVNYHPLYVEEGGHFDAILDLRKWRKNLTIAYLKVSNWFWIVKGNKEQHARFEAFRREHLGVRGERLYEAEDLSSVSKTDLFVCGSDQIWNPSVQKGLDPVYFLDFESARKARRISYAPSFGRSTLSKEYHDEAGKLISKLDGISVREKSGVDIVRSVSNCEAVCVPDPTILLGDFSELIGNTSPSSDKKVFCYALRTSDVIREVAEYVAKENGAKIISPTSSRQRWAPIGEAVEPGPAEWLRMVASSTFVVTNSFHGVALSLILNRPFFAVALPGKKGAMNERVQNLLRSTNMLSRIVSTSDPAEIEKVMKQEIDWESVNQHLADLRDVGERFLLDQINLVK
jgi:hypothetical protein